MCFSLPESNSFPGPRQLHINWPRRRCQGYSAQVLWRCHRRLSIDLEVRSYSACFPLSFMLSPTSFFLFFVSAYLPSLCMCDSLFVCFPLLLHTHRRRLFLLLFSSIPLLTAFLSLLLLLVLSSLSMFPLHSRFPLFCFLHLSFTLSVRSILSRGFTESHN